MTAWDNAQPGSLVICIKHHFHLSKVGFLPLRIYKVVRREADSGLAGSSDHVIVDTGRKSPSCCPITRNAFNRLFVTYKQIAN